MNNAHAPVEPLKKGMCMTPEDLAALAGATVLYLTTTGRQSGQPRTIEIWFTVHEGKLYLNAEHGRRAHWVRNLLREPQVHVRLGTYNFPGRARILERPQDAALWRTVAALSRQKYGWGEGTPVEITPVMATSPAS
jgi:deazaflavin-dependent oxidoreductase (nitroreductase family)